MGRRAAVNIGVACLSAVPGKVDIPGQRNSGPCNCCWAIRRWRTPCAISASRSATRSRNGWADRSLTKPAGLRPKAKRSQTGQQRTSSTSRAEDLDDPDDLRQACAIIRIVHLAFGPALSPAAARCATCCASCALASVTNGMRPDGTCDSRLSSNRAFASISAAREPLQLFG